MKLSRKKGGAARPHRTVKSHKRMPFARRRSIKARVSNANTIANYEAARISELMKVEAQIEELHRQAAELNRQAAFLEARAQTVRRQHEEIERLGEEGFFYSAESTPASSYNNAGSNGTNNDGSDANGRVNWLTGNMGRAGIAND